jgi:DNA-binding IclR family transcriptional regulator
MPPTAGYRQGFRRPAIREAIQSGADTVQAIAAHVGLSRPTVAEHLRLMREAREVRQVRQYGERAARWSLR